MSFNRSMFKSQTVEWPTPLAVYEALNKEFSFNFDPCPLGGEDDGLAPLFVSWANKRVFCNPPIWPRNGEVVTARFRGYGCGFLNTRTDGY